jgi:hypothetical protein
MISMENFGNTKQMAISMARSIAETLLVTHTAVLHHLHQSIGFKILRLHWVPHLLTDDLVAKRKQQATAMLPYLYATQNDDWQHLVIGDKSWFSFNTSPRRMWTLSRRNVGTKPRLQSQGKCVCLRLQGIRKPSEHHKI